MQKTTLINTQLERIGLTKNQSDIYLYLLSNGPKKVHSIALDLHLTRPLVYKVLDELLAILLVTKEISSMSKVAIFEATDPTHLEEIVLSKQREYVLADKTLDSVLSELIPIYTKEYQKPNVHFIEGIKGLDFVNKDILKEKTNILLFRSYLDKDTQEAHVAIRSQIEAQKKLGIRVRVISSQIPDLEMLEGDIRDNIQRKYLQKEKFSVPSQILVYGNKVAITSFGEKKITTIITSTDVQKTFSCLFEVVWSFAQNPRDLA